MPRIFWSSATESSSSSSKRRSRSRVGSARSLRKLMVDAILQLHDISTHHDWSICWLIICFSASPKSSALNLHSMLRRFIFASESVGEGHPDKVCDTISDAVLDACLRQDKRSRVACETYAKSNVVVVGGEITTKATLDYVQIVRDAVREIGYVNDDDVFHADRLFVQNIITCQSADISQGVDAKKAKGKKTAEQGAGDQGLMFGFACDDT